MIGRQVVLNLLLLFGLNLSLQVSMEIQSCRDNSNIQIKLKEQENYCQRSFRSKFNNQQQSSEIRIPEENQPGLACDNDVHSFAYRFKHSLQHNLRTKSIQETPLKDSERDLQFPYLLTKIKGRFKALINDLSNRRFQALSLKQFQIINDWSSNYEYYRPKLLAMQDYNKIKQFYYQKKAVILKTLSKISKKYPPIDPGHPICSFFDFLSLLVTLFIIYYYSIQFGFQYDLENSPIFCAIHKIGFLLFVFQIFLNLNVGFYQKDEIIKNRVQIFNNYKVALIEDVVSLLGLIYNFYNMTNSIQSYIIQSVFLMKLLSLQKQKKRLKDLLIYRYGQPPIYLFAKMLFKIVWYCHWIGILITIFNRYIFFVIIALIWHSVNYYEITYEGESDTWLQVMHIAEDNWHIRYIYAFYWAASTIVTGGSIPNTFLEVVASIFLIFPTAILFAYIIKEVGQIIDQITKQTKYFQKDLEIMNNYMRSKNVGQMLQKRIVYYLEKVYLNKSENANEKATKILQSFPQNLREDLNKEICLKIFNQNKILKENFSPKTIFSCLKIIEEQHFMPGDNIVNMNFQDDICLYLIISGQGLLNNISSSILPFIYAVELGVGMNQQGRDTSFGILTAGQCFGIQAFFSGLIKRYQAKSLTYTSIYKIKRSDFLKIIVNFNQDFENFCMIKDLLITTNMCPCIYDTCKLCGRQNDHNDIICNTVHFHPYANKQLNIIKKSQQGKQSREPFERIKRNRYHIYHNFSELEKAVVQLLDCDEVVSQIENLYYNEKSSSNYSDEQSLIQSQWDNNNMQQSSYQIAIHNNRDFSPLSFFKESKKSIYSVETPKQQEQADTVLDKDGYLKNIKQDDEIKKNTCLDLINFDYSLDEKQSELYQQQQQMQLHQIQNEKKEVELVPVAEEQFTSKVLNLTPQQEKRYLLLKSQQITTYGLENKLFSNKQQQPPQLQQQQHNNNNNKKLQQQRDKFLKATRRFSLQRDYIQPINLQLRRQKQSKKSGTNEELMQCILCESQQLQGQNDLQSQHHLQHQQQQQIRQMGINRSRKSIKTNCEVYQNNLNTTNVNEHNVKMKEIDQDFDRLYSFQTYFPLHNIAIVLKKLAIRRKIMIIQRGSPRNEQQPTSLRNIHIKKRKTQILSTFNRNRSQSQKKKITYIQQIVNDN